MAGKSKSLMMLLVLLEVLAGCSEQGTSKRSTGATVEAIPGGMFVAQVPEKIAKGMLSTGGKCALDSINGRSASADQRSRLKRGEEANFSGWAVDVSTGAASEELYIRLKGKSATYLALTTTRGQRDDVTKALNVAPTAKVGFELQAKTDQLATGTYDVSVVQPVSAGRIVECDVPMRLVVE